MAFNDTKAAGRLDEGPAAVASRRTWLATAVMLVAVFMELMDVTMANVAVPSIRKDLGASEAQVQWVVAGYSLAFAVALLINIPIGLGALAAARAWVAESTAPSAPRLDLAGALAGALSVFLLVFPVIQGRSAGWPAWGWVLLGLSVPAFGAFAVLEHRRGRQGKSVLADLSLLRRRGFSAGLLVTLVFFGGVTATAFVLMIYLQSGFGYSPLRAGLSLVPLALALVVGSGISVSASKRLGRTVLQAGCLVSAGGVIWLSQVAAGHPAALSIWDIVPPLAVFGLGLGLTVAPLTDFVLTGVPLPSAGSASGMQSAVIQAGNSIGVAVLGVIFFSLLAGHPAAISMRDTLYCDAGVFAATALLIFLMSPDTRTQPTNQ